MLDDEYYNCKIITIDEAIEMFYDDNLFRLFDEDDRSILRTLTGEDKLIIIGKFNGVIYYNSVDYNDYITIYPDTVKQYNTPEFITARRKKRIEGLI